MDRGEAALPEPTIRELAEGDELTVFRIIRTRDSASPRFTDAFRSRHELGLPPRAGTPEASQPEIHQGISVYRTFDAAAETARRVRKRGRDLGGHVAELRLPAGQGFHFAEWGARGHLTLWGDALKLQATVVDIHAI